MLIFRRLIWLQGLLMLCVGSVAQIDSSLTNCMSVLRLTPEQARENHPVRVRGVVTCYVPGSQLCFVQDETAGVYIQPAPWPSELEVGQVVEAEGTTGEGRFSPIIQLASIRPTNQKRSITPVHVSVEELNTGRFDCQFVELEGVVQNVEMGGNVVHLDVAVGGSTARVLIFSHENPPTNSIDSFVRVRGVAGTFYAGDQLSGFGVFLQSSSDFEVVRPAAEPFSQPHRTTAKLAWYSPDGAMDHRVHLRGAVTFVWPGDSFFLRDDNGSLRIVPAKPSLMPVAGDVLEVIGFLRNPTGPVSALVNAAWRKTGTTGLVEPRTIPLPQLLAAGPKGQLVSVEGTLLGIASTGAVSSVLLNDDGYTIRAFTQQPITPGLLRSTVRVLGVFSTPLGSPGNTTEPCLLLSGPNAMTMLRAAPVPPPVPARSNLLLAALVLFALILTAFAWATRKSSQQAHQLAQNTSARFHEMEQEAARLKDARERLGRDLHDHIIQSIYAIGLSVEDCRQSLADPGRIEARLKSALAEINDVIRELRNVILGLESNTIQPKEFRAALKSLALTLGDEKSNHIRLDLDQGALDSLSPAQATELIHIAREAMSNSIRHGHAQTTTVTLHPEPESLRFVVEDDGKGFNSQHADSKGYGLRNMAKRAEDLGAKFTIQAEEGVGTRIVLDIPKQKQHFSSSEPRSRIDR